MAVHKKTEADKIYISGYTMRTHAHHDNIGPFDYYLVQHMINNVYRVETPVKIGHIIYYCKFDNHYKAVFKRTVNDKGEDEIYLVSLLSSNKEKIG